jgi:hypothetical protein
MSARPRTASQSLRWTRYALPLAATIGVLAAAPSAGADTLVGVGNGTTLFTFDSAKPGTVSPPRTITGLQAGETIRGIDYRPANRRLYGVSSSGRLYTIDPGTAAASAVGPPLWSTAPGLSFGVDFDPAADRLRILMDSDQNLSVNPSTGTPDAPGPLLAYSAGDPNAGANPNVVASAHTNNVASPTHYGIDSALNALVVEDPASGALRTVGSLGVDPPAAVGFDIAAGGTAYFVSGFAGASLFHTINLTGGTATPISTIPVANVDGLAVVPAPVAQPPSGLAVPPPADAPAPLPGDFNLDGAVNAADYVVFRKAELTEDGLRVRLRTPTGVREGTVTELYTEWRVNFGRTAVASQRRSARPLLLARGRTTLRGDESRRVRIPLTRAGRRALRRYQGRRLTVALTLRVTYRPGPGAQPQRRTFRRTVRVRVKDDPRRG